MGTMRRSVHRVAGLAALLVAGAWGCGGGGGGGCAEPGTYVASAVRSANPGTCPAGIALPFEWDDIEVLPGERSCGQEIVVFSGA